ncbi:hypothetical protein BMF94_3096 [Rhodotorula taiwanensis]|uniref:Cleavage/polyadenylation specificity factor A subunit C-terminal domain-containing protein n=1 Tax=Rhodotorula taiwanensis TaxID=741276 RepID=A0A2S5BAP8_9BASI|nr:hypothetical protein BMF94_3096 [Rhodotorula taiwanensis]
MAPLTALHRQTVPPSGHSLAVACRLTGDARQRHLVTARNNALHVYAVRENRLVWLATRQLHGRVTGLQRLAAKGGDRLVVAVHHAKMCLLEWDERQHDLCPVSLHTYEKLPQVDDEREAHLSVDPASRLVALLLPTNSGGDATLALLPLFAAEDTGDDNEIEGVPYAPSHLVPLASLTQPVNAPQGAPNAFAPNASTPPIRNVVSMAFLPGFTEPTLALLYAPDWTWAGRLEYLAQNFLVSLVTLSTKSEGGTRAVVISTSPALPYSCLALKPCPTALGGTGGVLVTTANGLLYVDAQSGRVVAVPVNGWFARDYPPGRPKPAGLVTTGDAATPLKALVWCRSGAVFDLSFTLTGRTIASLHLERVADAGSLTGGGAASLIRLGGDLIFVGSETGSSALLRWRDTLKNEAAPSNVLDLLQAVPARSEAMDVDQEEEDIYGDAKPQPAKIDPSALASLASALAAQKPSPVQLEVCDTLPGYGAIRNMTTGLIDEESPAELVASTGAGMSAGLTVFRRNLYLTNRRSLHLPATLNTSEATFMPSVGLWRIQLAPVVDEAMQQVWIASDKEQTLLLRSTVNGLEIVQERPSSTLAAVPLAGGNAIALVSHASIVILDSQLQELQQLDLPHPLHPAAHPPHVSSTDSHLVVHVPVSAGGARSRTTPLVYSFDGGQLFPLDLDAFDMAPAPERKAGKRTAVFCDSLAAVPLARPIASKVAQEAKDDNDEDALYGGGDEAKPAAAAPSDGIVQPQDLGAERWEWIAEIDSKGDMKIRLLPSGVEIFSSSAVTLFPTVIEDGETERQIADSVDPDDVKVDRISLAYVGRNGQEALHLLILLTNGQLAVYEAHVSLTAPSTAFGGAMPRLACRFVKTAIRYLPSAPTRRKNAPASDLPPPRRDLRPFRSVGGHAGVFIAGEEAIWVLKGEHGPVRCVENADRGVYGFCELAGGLQQDELGGPVEGDEVAVQTRETLAIARMPRDIVFDSPLPYTLVPKDRVYSHVAFDLQTGLYVGSTLHETKFVAFDEEGQPMWKERDPELVEPSVHRSTLELLVPDTWEAIHGYEFRQNEFVTSLKSVSLESKSSRTGLRDFIAVGTAVARAEDLTIKGGIYIFEVVPVNPHPSVPRLDHEVRLMYFEEAKAAVNNVCDLNGYLFLSMGQKLYARAFEQDEFLLAIGFLDVGVHVTTLTGLKNFLLIGDEQQSISLVAFQEDPYKLVMLGRDFRPSRVGGANFIVNEGKLAFVSNDDRGVLRIFEYDPTNIASYAGHRLMCRTEYAAGSDSYASILFAKHLPNEDAKQNGILYGGLDGSLFSLVPVRDAVFKRLQSLQTLMMRHVLHFAGLNPRGYRIVKNDSVSRAITKGILDGDLLAAFEQLSLDQQLELAEAVGTDPDTVLANLRNLRGYE